jgi:superfamily I DNA/RNA helicase
MLKHEIRNKTKLMQINNLVVHTYHSLAVNYYTKYAYTDEEIKKILLNNTVCKNSDNYDVVLIDETQDMMNDYYLLVKKFIKDTKSNPQILIFGDVYQGIYEFKGSSYKFLTLANRIWKKEFEQMTLSTSFRMTNQTAWFVNNCILGYNRINCIKDGPKVDYYICNSYKIYEELGKNIIQMIKKEKIKEEDIFILSPSIKADNPYKRLENYLVAHNYKCMTPLSDDTKLDDKIINNKIVFTTYHQSKGRERKVVILYNFDSSYFDYYLRGG